MRLDGSTVVLVYTTVGTAGTSSAYSLTISRYQIAGTLCQLTAVPPYVRNWRRVKGM